MEINLYINNSEKEKIGKSLSNKTSMSGYLKEGSSVVNPSVKVQITNPSGLNYAYIPEFKRYYFISEMTNVKNNIWELSLHCDVLESFKSQIKGNTAIIEKNAYSENSNRYFNDGETFFHDSKETNEIANFQDGFDESPNYILITAGA